MKTIRNIQDLQPDPNNPNKGSERGSFLLEESMRNLGAGRSIVTDKNGIVLAGNKALQAAVDAGIEEITPVRTHGESLVVVIREDLDLYGDDRARELTIADNRAGEVGLTWDVNVLQAIKDSAEVKIERYFHEEELNRIIGAASTATPKTDNPTESPSKTPLANCPNCGFILSGL